MSRNVGRTVISGISRLKTATVFVVPDSGSTKLAILVPADSSGDNELDEE
jgi:hypothetical protein